MYPVIIFWNNSQWIALRTSMPTSIDEIGDINKELVKVVDLLGRESEIIKNKVLLYIYSDGSVDKKIVR